MFAAFLKTVETFFFGHKIQIKVDSFSFMFVLEMEGMNKKQGNEVFFCPNSQIILLFRNLAKIDSLIKIKGVSKYFKSK